VTRDEVAAVIAERTAGHGGPLSRACFDTRDDECGLWGCHCRCHFVTATHLQHIIRHDQKVAS
jgi:hypothetical protein